MYIHFQVDYKKHMQSLLNKAMSALENDLKLGIMLNNKTYPINLFDSGTRTFLSPGIPL